MTADPAMSVETRCRAGLPPVREFACAGMFGKMRLCFIDEQRARTPELNLFVSALNPAPDGRRRRPHKASTGNVPCCATLRRQRARIRDVWKRDRSGSRFTSTCGDGRIQVSASSSNDNTLRKILLATDALLRYATRWRLATSVLFGGDDYVPTNASRACWIMAAIAGFLILRSTETA